MKKTKRSTVEVTAEEARLLGHLPQHPQMTARVQSTLEIACDEAGPIRTADQVEAMLL